MTNVTFEDIVLSFAFATKEGAEAFAAEGQGPMLTWEDMATAES